MATLLFTKSDKQTDIIHGLLKLIHSDVCGPMRLESLGQSSYFVTFTDDFSRYTNIYFLKQKSEISQKFEHFKAKVENLSGRKMKYLQYIEGTEYKNKDFDDYLKTCRKMGTTGCQLQLLEVLAVQIWLGLVKERKTSKGMPSSQGNILSHEWAFAVEVPVEEALEGPDHFE